MAMQVDEAPLEEMLHIPCQTTGEVMHISESEIVGTRAEDLLDILKNVKAPLDSWVNIAVAYYRAGKYQAFEGMFRAMIAPG
jgi:hypothetical protein